mmetsp:Transcript_20482/g.28929  ORF Transcript_20482/g.28929 Transcript_20482/m.28929 type:complete len:237 (+) Transcript_20482:387-1097(+)
MAATATRALISSASNPGDDFFFFFAPFVVVLVVVPAFTLLPLLLLFLFDFAAMVPMEKNSCPNNRTALARLIRSSLGTVASLNNFVQTCFNVFCISRLLRTQANSKTTGNESSMVSAIFSSIMALVFSSSAIFVVVAAVGSPCCGCCDCFSSPLPLPFCCCCCFSSKSRCIFSASTMALDVTLATFSPAPSNFILVPKEVAFFLVRAICPPIPKNVVSNPKYSSAANWKACPIVWA